MPARTSLFATLALWPAPFSRRLQCLLRLLFVGTTALILVACGEPTPTPTPPSIGIQAQPPTAPAEEPIATPTPVSISTPVPASSDRADADALPALFAESLGIAVQPNSGGWESIEVLRLAPAQRWAVYTTGFRSHEPAQNHAVALFAQEEGRWIELGRVELACGDYVYPGSVRQVWLDQDSLWLTVDSGTGAHSGCFDLLRWDGATLAAVVSGFNSSPGAGTVQDVDRDGQPEVILNDAHPYVFCYACGVGLFGLSLLRWDGESLRAVQLTRLPSETVADLRDANNRAVELAGANLFPPAVALIDAALSYAPNDERVYWNRQLIHLLAEGHRSYANSSPYPLLNWIFYGDWDAALAELDDFTPAQIFDPQLTILRESAAAGWESALAAWIFQFSGAALDANPALDAAWFLRGWAHFLQDPGDPRVREAVIAAVEEAAQLAPDQPLYRASLDHLQETPAPTATEAVRFAAGATSATLTPTLSPGAPIGYVLGIAAGQRLWVTATGGDVNFWVLDPDGKTLSPVTPLTTGSGEYAIPRAGDYTLVIDGEGAAEIVVEIPPR